MLKDFLGTLVDAGQGSNLGSASLIRTTPHSEKVILVKRGSTKASRDYKFFISFVLGNIGPVQLKIIREHSLGFKSLQRLIVVDNHLFGGGYTHLKGLTSASLGLNVFFI